MWRALVPVLILAAATEPATEPATELPLLPEGALGPVKPLRFNRGPLGGDIPAGCVQLELGVDTQGAVVSARIQQSSRRREIDRQVLHGIASHRFDPALRLASVNRWRAFVNWSVNGRSSVLGSACAPIGDGDAQRHDQSNVNNTVRLRGS